MNWADAITQFHFLRPLWLLALPAGLLFLFLLRRQLSHASNWQSVIDPQLLGFLIDQPGQARQRRWAGLSLVLAWFIACLAMAGPAWERSQQEVVKSQSALILVLDMSLSMYAQDQQPSRLVHARRKISDLMAARKDGLTALVVYSGDAHIVAPLTDDRETINTLLPALEPQIMPKFGSNLPAALREAEKVLQHGGLQQAELVLLTDEISPTHLAAIDQLDKQKFHVAFLAFGTADGAPVPLQQGFLKDQSGTTVIARLNWDDISSYARQNNLLAVQSGLDDNDINLLLENVRHTDDHKASQGEFDQWQDYGHWLALLLLPLLLLNFRRSWILLALFIIWPDNSYAMGWKDLWQTPDQQAANAFAANDYKTAAGQFTDPQWKASADYKSGNYKAALDGFSKDASADGLYNQGNALAKSGHLEEAIKAYAQALQKAPGMTDAASNKALVEKLLQEQKQQQEEQKQQQQEQENRQDQQQDNQQQDSQQGSEQQDGSQQGQQGESGAGQAQDGQQQQETGQPQDSKAQGEQAEAARQDTQSHNDQEPSGQEPGPQQNNEANAQKTEDKPANAAAQDAPDKKGDEQAQVQSAAEMTPEEKEQQQALQQWLRKIPDDPGQLLRNKFRYQYEKNRQNNEHIDRDSEQLW